MKLEARANIIKENISFEDWKLYKYDENLSKEEKAVIDNDFEKKYINILENFLLNGVLNKVEHSDKHKTKFSNSWNKFIDGDSLSHYDVEEITKIIFKPLISSFFTKLDDESAYNKFVDDLSQGNNKYVITDLECNCCGKSLTIDMNNWEMKFYYLDVLSDDGIVRENESQIEKFLRLNVRKEADTCFDKKVNIQEIDIDDDTLIICNWIKLKEFTSQVEYDNNSYYFNINTRKGRYEQTEHYLNQGFISINSYASYSINGLRDNDYKDSLLFCMMDEENTASVDIVNEKNIYGDYKGITIISKKKLIEIINLSLSDIKLSESKVEEYLIKNKEELYIRNVTPGRYVFVHDLDRDIVNDLLYHENINDEQHKPVLYFYKKDYFPFNKNDVSEKNIVKKLKR